MTTSSILEKLHAKIFAAALCCALACFFGVSSAQAEELAPTALSPQATSSANVGTQDMYRLYNMNSGEHFYTSNVSERDYLQSIGWFYEGVGWVAPRSSNTPVFRLYNPNAGDHHYTPSAKERDVLVKAGWRYEGVCWYSDDKKRVSILRAYNPNARAGAHHFTNSNEERGGLVNAGWRDEGVGWYAVDGGRADQYTLNMTHSRILLDHAPTGWGVTTFRGDISPMYRASIENYLRTSPTVGFIAINMRTGKVVSHNADVELFSASSIKASYLASVCKYDAPGVRGREDQIAYIFETSDNEEYADISGYYGKGYLQRFANEAGVYLDLNQYNGCYVDYTPRKLCKLWLLITDYMRSNQVNADMFRGFFDGDVFKLGWMNDGAWSGIIHNIGGVSGNVVYAVLSREPIRANLFALRNTIVDSVQL